MIGWLIYFDWYTLDLFKILEKNNNVDYFLLEMDETRNVLVIVKVSEAV